MNDISSVNSQMIDSVTGMVTLLTGQAPSQAFGLLDAVMVETLGVAMHNAVSRQQNAGMISSAAVTAACAKMLAVPFPEPPPPPPPPAPAPPSVTPLPGPPADPSADAAVAAAYAQAESAIGILKAQAAGAADLGQTVQTDLGKLITDAGGTPPAAASGPAGTAPDTGTATGDSTGDDAAGGGTTGGNSGGGSATGGASSGGGSG
jgi:U5 snRNP spliceosome subunit